MGALRLPRMLLLGLLGLLLAATFSAAAAPQAAAVVGTTECLDCTEKNVKPDLAFAGLRVTIKCKAGNENYKTKAVGKLDKNGEFNVQLASELLREDGELKSECAAQLHGQSNTPCGLKPSKLTLKLKKDGVHTFGADGKLSFSATCVSATFWPPYKFPPLLPKWKHPWKKSLPLPPFHFHHKHYFHKPAPVYTPPTPVYKPPAPVPVYKPPTPVPVYKPPYKPPTPVYKPPYKPPTPVYKPPYKPPTPVYKPPYKPPTPVYKPPYKPPTPVYKPPYKPPVPVYKPPTPVYKPPTPVYKPIPPPVYKKPCPPFFKKPPFPYHPHPKIGFPGWPPMPPFHKIPKVYKPKHPVFPPTKVHPKN